MEKNRYAWDSIHQLMWLIHGLKLKKLDATESIINEAIFGVMYAYVLIMVHYASNPLENNIFDTHPPG